ncbi:MAG: outer membrane lipoprotein-sorting protein [Gammaproteobacteria bacterium]
MNARHRPRLPLLICTALLLASVRAHAAPDATALVRAALHQWRGDSSYTELTMLIHRPDWQRRSSLVGWTQGKADSLVRFTAPPGDAGNATLKRGPALWLYNPKLGQVIKLPFSMMAQGWAGSDFSYNDLAKTDQIVTDYTHQLAGTADSNGHKVHTIVCVPKPSAPVVWGKIVLRIRDDDVLLSETWFAQSMKPVRRLETLKIAPLGGRAYPVKMRMNVLDKPGHWTEITTTSGRFDLKLPAYLFTLSNLRNPRPWSAP